MNSPTPNNNANIYSKLLGKDEFVKAMKEQGVEVQDIEGMWDRVEKVFSLFYFQACYEQLDDDHKKEIGLEINISKGELETFIKNMNDLIKKKPELINQQKAIKSAMNLTIEKVKQRVNERSVYGK